MSRQNRYHRHRRRRSGEERNPPALSGCAPADLIRQDFHALDSHETLRTTWSNEQLILLQSVQGHAHEGHALFAGRRFPNTTIDDVVRALRLDPLRVREDRQDLIDQVADYVEQTIAGKPPPALVLDGGEPILGISTLRYLSVEPMDVLRGLYLGGLRDDTDVRLEVERERGVRIGGGRGYLVDFRRMEALGLDAEKLARGEWAEEIPRFEREGLIVPEERRDEPGVSYQYIRSRRGPGASDDAAIVGAGMMWGLGVAVGVFFADAVDTLEKYVPEPSDEDEEIALRIEEAANSLGMGREEAKRLTFVAAVPEAEKSEVPDSSLRHLLSINRDHDLCALEAHLLAAQGIPAPSIGLSHERLPSRRFYEYVRRRIDSV